ncbi:MAG: biopolymer transporter ExbD [Ignavibacteria bacterium]
MRRYKLDEKEFSEINITPFTDVVLVLLLIFMIASPFLVTGALKVKLPESTTSENTGDKSIEVYLNDKNQIYMNDKQINLSELQLSLQVQLLNKVNKEVIIQADKGALHGNFVQLLDVLKKAGATKFLIATAKVNK